MKTGFVVLLAMMLGAGTLVAQGGSQQSESTFKANSTAPQSATGDAYAACGGGMSTFGVAGMEDLQGIASGVATLTDQNAKHHNKKKRSTIVVTAPQVYCGCPVGMQAQHLSDGSVVKTKGGHPSQLGQWVHLTLVSRQQKTIVGATMMVRGATAKGRTMQAGTAQDGASEAMHVVTAHFSADGSGSASADFWVPGLTAVKTIELYAVTYSDGATWKMADGIGCSVTPDVKMLVTSR